MYTYIVIEIKSFQRAWSINECGTLMNGICVTCTVYIVYVNKMSPYSNSNYLSSTVKLLLNYCSVKMKLLSNY